LDELVMQRGQHVQDDEADKDAGEPEVRLKGRIGREAFRQRRTGAREHDLRQAGGERRRKARPRHQDDQDVETVVHDRREAVGRRRPRRTAILRGSAFSIAARAKKPTARAARISTASSLCSVTNTG